MPPTLLKFRYEYPAMEAHFFEAPSADAAVRFIRRAFPHNTREVLTTLREIPRWPAFWKTIDDQGRELPRSE